MNTNSFKRLSLGMAASTLALVALTIGTATADSPSSIAHFFSSHPMISGTVVSVNDHNMVVDTDQGEQVTLLVDSRTMAPRDFAPGMVMRAEFRALEDCRLYAEKIIPIRAGMSTDRLQAYANTREGGTVVSTNLSDYVDSHGYANASRLIAHDAANRDASRDEQSPGPIMNATTSTKDYTYSNRPLLTGTVLSVNDHRMVVATDQGQTVALTMDSRTMLPREVAPGTIVRAQFTPFQDGRYFAQRISRIGHRVGDREQAYAHTRDSEFAVASAVPDCGPAITPSTTTSVIETRREPVYAQAPAPIVSEPVVEERAEELPQTASKQPLILLFGLGALGLAGLVAAARALRIV